MNLKKMLLIAALFFLISHIKTFSEDNLTLYGVQVGSSIKNISDENIQLLSLGFVENLFINSNFSIISNYQLNFDVKNGKTKYLTLIIGLNSGFTKSSDFQIFYNLGAGISGGNIEEEFSLALSGIANIGIGYSHYNLVFGVDKHIFEHREISYSHISFYYIF